VELHQVPRRARRHVADEFESSRRLHVVLRQVGRHHDRRIEWITAWFANCLACIELNVLPPAPTSSRARRVIRRAVQHAREHELRFVVGAVGRLAPRVVLDAARPSRARRFG
jgi:hypothetical protein